MGASRSARPALSARRPTGRGSASSPEVRRRQPRRPIRSSRSSRKVAAVRREGPMFAASRRAAPRKNFRVPSISNAHLIIALRMRYARKSCIVCHLPGQIASKGVRSFQHQGWFGQRAEPDNLRKTARCKARNGLMRPHESGKTRQVVHGDHIETF